jgi:hypothetical protein
MNESLPPSTTPPLRDGSVRFSVGHLLSGFSPSTAPFPVVIAAMPYAAGNLPLPCTIFVD